MMLDLAIRGGAVVTAADIARCDVGIKDGVIVQLAETIEGARAEIDATGRLLLPGGIDSHVHLDQASGPGIVMADDFESGTMAAAFGGTTSIVDFAIQYKGQTLHHAWETWMKKAEGKACIDYGFHVIITDLPDSVEQEMDSMVKEGISSFKLFMAYRGVLMLDDGAIFRAMKKTGENGGLICMHAENGDVIEVLVRRALAAGHTAPKYHALTRPARAEAEATHRAIARCFCNGREACVDRGRYRVRRHLGASEHCRRLDLPDRQEERRKCHDQQCQQADVGNPRAFGRGSLSHQVKQAEGQTPDQQRLEGDRVDHCECRQLDAAAGERLRLEAALLNQVQDRRYKRDKKCSVGG